MPKRLGKHICGCVCEEVSREDKLKGERPHRNMDTIPQAGDGMKEGKEDSHRADISLSLSLSFPSLLPPSHSHCPSWCQFVSCSSLTLPSLHHDGNLKQ